MTNMQQIDSLIAQMKITSRKENKEDIDETLAIIKEICLKHDLRVGQLFENIRNLSEENDLFHYSNKRLTLTIQKDFING